MQMLHESVAWNSFLKSVDLVMQHWTLCPNFLLYLAAILLSAAHEDLMFLQKTLCASAQHNSFPVVECPPQWVCNGSFYRRLLLS